MIELIREVRLQFGDLVRWDLSRKFGKHFVNRLAGSASNSVVLRWEYYDTKSLTREVRNARPDLLPSSFEFEQWDCHSKYLLRLLSLFIAQDDTIAGTPGQP